MFLHFNAPGDDLYPDDPDFTGSREHITHDTPVMDLFRDGCRHHRAMWTNRAVHYLCNIQPHLGHLSPDDSIIWGPASEH